jgi:hypothetical protein
MTRQGQVTVAANEHGSSWSSVSRTALLERLSAPAAVKQLNIGFSVDTGEAFPTFCRDQGEVRKLLARRDLLAAELRDAA